MAEGGKSAVNRGCPKTLETGRDYFHRTGFDQFAIFIAPIENKPTLYKEASWYWKVFVYHNLKNKKLHKKTKQNKNIFARMVQ